MALYVNTHRLPQRVAAPQISVMAHPLFDFSHLSPAERIELAEQLWDSLDPSATALTDAQAAELRRRRAELEADAEPGEPWEQALNEIEHRGSAATDVAAPDVVFTSRLVRPMYRCATADEVRQ